MVPLGTIPSKSLNASRTAKIRRQIGDTYRRYMSPFNSVAPVASAAAAEAAGAGSVRASLGFVDLEGPALDVFAVQKLIGESGDRMRRPPLLAALAKLV
jgi:hypothetical protein